jgi:small subunit ribosomal protein S8
MFNDSIADLLTRIRNASTARKQTVVMPYSKLKQQVAEILKSNGFIAEVKVTKDGGFQSLELTLTGGRGLVIVSTSSGVMTGREAHKKGLGGELICKVW